MPAATAARPKRPPLSRLDKAARIPFAATRRLGLDRFLVPSQSGQDAYTVDTAARTCTCVDFTRRGEACKHLIRLTVCPACGLVGLIHAMGRIGGRGYVYTVACADWEHCSWGEWWD